MVYLLLEANTFMVFLPVGEEAWRARPYMCLDIDKAASPPMNHPK